MKKIETLVATVEDIVYKNDDNGYAVLRVEVEGEKDSIICVGNLSGIVPGENVEFEGFYDSHDKYGEQFKVNSYKKNMPSSIDGIWKYLGSGVIPGIGLRIARRIVDKYGEKTLEVIEEDFTKLAEIRGITLLKAKEISIIFSKQRVMRDVILKLSKYDISTNLAIKIYEQYEEKAIEKVENNPYVLVRDIKGVGFKIADSIAMKIGIDSNDINRIKAGIKYVLGQCSMNGHTFLPMELLKKEAEEFLKVDETLIDNAIVDLQVRKEIYIENINKQKAVYLDILYYAEGVVAVKINELQTLDEKIDKSNIDKKIKEIEKQTNIKLAEKQKQAIHEVMKNGVSIITGGPGTGKTTLINFLIKILEAEGKVINLAAPTGRAAKRMTEATGFEAKTIHRLLEVKVGSDDDYQRFEKCETNPIEADVLIVDETSMLDIYIASSLLRAVMKGTKLVFVGDHNQLPSVGPGNFLGDLISSKNVCTIELTEIYRQSADSHITVNAHKINKGEYPEISEHSKDFFFITRKDVKSVINTMIELVENRIPTKLGCETSDIQILSPMRKSELGVDYLNIVFQNIINPEKKGKKQKEIGKRIFRVGDRVMQIRNNYTIDWEKLDSMGNKVDFGQGVFNGEQGKILDISDADGSFQIIFDDDKIVRCSSMGMEDIEHAYAVTIHKSQGSEYPVVIIPLLSGPEMLMTRNLLYTAITRAKKMILLVGVKETMNRMIDNNKVIERYSGLCERLK